MKKKLTKRQLFEMEFEATIRHAIDWELDTGGVLWLVRDETDSDGSVERVIIACFIEWHPKHRCWIFDDIYEQMGPSALTCPIRFFSLAPPYFQNGDTR